jgi:hypothetical protein
MLKNIVEMETEVSTRKYTFHCEPNAPLPDVYEALNQFRSYVYGRLKEHEEQQKASAEAPVEQPQG